MTRATTAEWWTLASEGRGVESSSRPTARRPLRLQRTRRPLPPTPGQTSTSPASRNRRSLAAVTALLVPAHNPTTSLGPSRTWPRTPRPPDLSPLSAAFLALGICPQDVSTPLRPQPPRLPPPPDNAADHAHSHREGARSAAPKGLKPAFRGEVAADERSGESSGGLSGSPELRLTVLAVDTYLAGLAHPARCDAQEIDPLEQAARSVHGGLAMTATGTHLGMDREVKLDEPLLDSAEAARLLNVPRSTLL